MMNVIYKILFSTVLVVNLTDIYSQSFIRSNVLLGDNTNEIIESANDSEGNTYILGQFTGNFQSFESLNSSVDLYLAKYDSLFNLQWINHIGSDGNEYNADLTIDDSANVSVISSFTGWGKFSPTDSIQSEGNNDIGLAKYNSSGSLIWLKNIGFGSGNQNPTSIEVDKDNNYIITGFFSDSIKFENDTLIKSTGLVANFIAKFSGSSNFLWSKKVEQSSLSRITSVKAFDDGYYFTGNFRDNMYFDIDTISSYADGIRDVFLYKTNFNGNGQWIRRTYGSAHEVTGTVSRDVYGNVYYTGYFQSSDLQIDSTNNYVSNVNLNNKGGQDIFIFKYNKNGTLLWANGYGSTSDDWGLNIEIIDRLLYVTGKISDTTIFGKDTLITSSSGDAEVFIAGFDDKGNSIKSIILNANGSDLGRSLVVNDPNGAIVSGYFESNTFNVGDSTYNLTGSRGSFIAEYEAPFSSAFTTTDNISCTDAEDGRLIVTPFLGAPPYTYDWSSNVTDSNDSLAYNLGPGTYSVTITDALDNTTTESIDISEPSPITITLDSVNNTSCFDGNDGELYISVSGGTGSYSYDWSGGSGANPEDQDQTGLSAADYIVEVTDENACTAIDTFTVSEPAPIQFTGSIAYGTSTQGGSDGAIGLEVAGGTPGYGYTWTGPEGPYPDSDTLSNLIGGNYTVEVTDTNSCTADTTLNVSDEGNIVLSISNILPVTCKNDSNGYVVANIENNTVNVEYTWKKDSVILEGPTEGLKSKDSLPGGTYWLIAQEIADLQRIDSVQFFVDEATDSLQTTLAGTNPDCFGDADGVINLSVTGGITPYSYQWSNGATSEDLSNLPASENYYVVTVTDNYGCEKSDSIQITEPDAITNNFTIDQIISCHGESTGILTAHASGGNGPYAFFWDDPGNQTDSTATNLTAASYEVQIIDQNDCDIFDTITLTEPDIFELLSIDSNYVTCFNGTDGLISIDVQGGTSPYQYIWFDTPDNVATRSDLSAGTYQVNITDQYGCNDFDHTIDIEQPASPLTVDTLTGSVDPVSCFGLADGALEMTGSGGWGSLEYAFNDGSYGAQTAFNSLSANTYEIKVRDNMGCVDSMDVDINEPAELVVNESMPGHVDVGCNGSANGELVVTKTGGNSNFEFSMDNQNWLTDSTFTGLAGGDYRIRVRDNMNCADSVDISIKEPEVLTISEVAGNHQDVSCYGFDDGSLMVTKTGGNTSFEFQMDNEGWISDSLYESLTAATYKLKVRDEMGCADSMNINVAEPDSLIASVNTLADPSCFGLSDGSVELAVAGGNSSMEYSQDQVNWKTDNIFSSLSGGNYTFYARDAMNCADSVSVSLTEPDAITLTEQAGAHVDVECYGDETGELAVSASGGTETFEFTADGVNYQSASQFTQLAASTYRIKARDGNNCEDSLDIAISQPDNPITTNVSLENVTCHGDADGTITMTATGGTEPYQFSMNATNWFSNGEFTGLAPESYEVFTRDASSCVDTIDVTINEPPSISIINESVDGNEISVLAVGGTGNLTYELDGIVQSNGDFTVTSGGNYTVTIRDGNDCTIESNTFDVLLSVGKAFERIPGKLYPNPARDQLIAEIHGLEPNHEYKLILHTLEGQTVIRESVLTDNQGSINKQLDVSHLAAGIYMVRLNDRVVPQKVVKE